MCTAAFEHMTAMAKNEIFSAFRGHVRDDVPDQDPNAQWSRWLVLQERDVRKRVNVVGDDTKTPLPLSAHAQANKAFRQEVWKTTISNHPDRFINMINGKPHVVTTWEQSSARCIFVLHKFSHECALSPMTYRQEELRIVTGARDGK